MATISLQRISAAQGPLQTLHDVSFEIRDHELFVVMGLPGSGKSQLARIIVGLERPTSGEVLINGTDVTRYRPKLRNTAMVFRDFGLYPRLNVYQNIEFPLRSTRSTAAERQERVRHVSAELDLNDALVLHPHDLTPLQKQRAALARAIVRDPSVLVLDNPLHALNNSNRGEFVALVRHVHHAFKVSVAFLTSDSEHALAIADRMVVLDRGQALQTGAPTDIYTRPVDAAVAMLAGTPPMNLIRGSVRDGAFRGPDTCVFTDDDDLSDALIGIRPEELTVVSPETAVTQDLGLITTSVYAVGGHGETRLVSARVGGQMIFAKVSDKVNVAIGDHIGLQAAADQWHLFDGQTGRRVGSVPSSLRPPAMRNTGKTRGRRKAAV